MTFSSIEFIGIFLPILLIIYMLAGERLRGAVLLIGSLVFYGLGGGIFCLLLLIITVLVNFCFDRLSEHILRRKKIMLSVELFWNFGLLFFFKYFNIAAEYLNSRAGIESIFPLFLSLPLGISFYTFQIVSYQADVYRGTQKRCSSFWEFALYVCMFPKLTNGPITRFREIEDSLRKPALCAENIESGLKSFTLGLSMKVLLADKIAALFANIQGIGVRNLDAAAAWLGALAFSFQIYFDFWGYSLMAVGIGRLFGYMLPENFNHPYIAKSATEFWRRWHITLSGWFRDYVYIPLGGNRRGKARTCLNLFLVWLFTGMWHGAHFNYIIWGLFFFVLLVLEKAGLGKRMERTKVLGHLYCGAVILISWVIFSQTDLNGLVTYSNFPHPKRVCTLKTQ